MTEKKSALFIEGNRSGYSPDQCEHRTMTIAELIDALQEMGDAYGMDANVFLRNDRGYTYGSIGWDDLSIAKYDEHRVYDWDDEDEDDEGEW